MCVHCLCSVPVEARRKADYLELELETIVKCHVYAGDQIQVFFESSKYY